jgi:glutamate formiminotransferase/formiminotetrahydrofolate cyclodeaminase
MQKLLECVPNFSEGRNPEIIRQISEAITSTEGVELLDVDPGKATNRTVMTFVGPPERVVEAAFQAIKKARELIDMRHHKGEHPRFGATDVCPLVPVSGITMEEAADWARKLGERVGRELEFPVFLYESAASAPHRKNLASVRSGEYEGLEAKLKLPEWQPDFGPAAFVPKTGTIAIGARDFLIAVNFNLNTTSVRRANAISFDVREAGRVVKEKDPATGIETETRVPGTLKAAKAIGWFIEEYGVAQVSMNLTDIRTTPLHTAFDAVNDSAQSRGLRVSGTEIVGMVPLRVLTDAGKHYLRKQNRSVGLPDAELIKIAIKSMGLDDLAPFDPAQKVIEYKIGQKEGAKLIGLSLEKFTEEVASESPAPGGGSVAAYIASCGASLATMVANLSAHKRGWDDRWEFFSDWAEKGESIRRKLNAAVDADTQAFNKVMEAFGLPKDSPEEKALRSEAIQKAQLGAVEVPLEVMRVAASGLPVAEAMAKEGNPNSITDAAVGAAALVSGIYGAYLNVLINLKDLKDKELAAKLRKEAEGILAEAETAGAAVRMLVLERIGEGF